LAFGVPTLAFNAPPSKADLLTTQLSLLNIYAAATLQSQRGRNNVSKTLVECNTVKQLSILPTMDPATIVSLINASLGLRLKCGQVVCDLYILINKFKQADLSIQALINQCDTMKTTVSKIESFITTLGNEIQVDDNVIRQLDANLGFGMTVLSTLEKDLVPLCNLEYAEGIRQRSSIVWNDLIIKDYQGHIRDQLIGLTCLLEVLKLYARLVHTADS
jgi:hypothetical protein